MTKIKIDVVIGKSLSGKSYAVQQILKQCVDDRAVQRLITCTTRPMRVEDQPDLTYHFWSNRQLMTTLDQSPADIIAPREYQVQHGHEQSVWRYFVNRQDLLAVPDHVQHLLLIIDWQGYLDLMIAVSHDRELSQKFDVNGFYVNAPLQTRLFRMTNSSRSVDDPAEMLRRVYYDEFIDFKQLDYLVQMSPQQLQQQYAVTVYESSQELITNYLAMLSGDSKTESN